MQDFQAQSWRYRWKATGPFIEYFLPFFCWFWPLFTIFFCHSRPFFCHLKQLLTTFGPFEPSLAASGCCWCLLVNLANFGHFWLYLLLPGCFWSFLAFFFGCFWPILVIFGHFVTAFGCLLLLLATLACEVSQCTCEVKAAAGRCRAMWDPKGRVILGAWWEVRARSHVVPGPFLKTQVGPRGLIFGKASYLGPQY